MPSFLIAEDHSVVRMGAILMLQAIYPDAAISEANTFDSCIERLNNQSFDLLLLDIHMPGGDNLQMITAVRLRQPDIKILIFSSYDEQLYAIRYITTGADGFLSKSAPPELFKLAIKQVLNGEKYISEAVQKMVLADRLSSKKTGSIETILSAREMEVMQLLIKGVRNIEIKELLNIKNSTISTYKTRIFEKTGVSNIIDLAAKVRLMGKEE